MAVFLAQEVWADSTETLKKRLGAKVKRPNRVISFMTRRIVLEKEVLAKEAHPSFVFWGRLHPQKNIKRAIRLFAKIREKHPAAFFTIVGPDGGDLLAIQELVSELGIEDSLKFVGKMDFDGIANLAIRSCFYLQTSTIEGMAMAVVEAMQLGLVPVVTPVGEIGRYCKNNFNSIFVSDDSSTVGNVCHLLADQNDYNRIRCSSIETWRDTSTYREDVLDACDELFKF
jgi:glycosyltransferase involved in cell wall biosynthesis